MSVLRLLRIVIASLVMFRVRLVLGGVVRTFEQVDMNNSGLFLENDLKRFLGINLSLESRENKVTVQNENIYANNRRREVISPADAKQNVISRSWTDDDDSDDVSSRKSNSVSSVPTVRLFWDAITKPKNVMSGEEFLRLSSEGSLIADAAQLLRRHIRSAAGKGKRKRKQCSPKDGGTLSFCLSKRAIDKLNNFTLPQPMNNSHHACPAKYVKDVEENRIPRVMYRAKCNVGYPCKIQNLTEDRSCEEVKLKYFVLRRVGNSGRLYVPEETEVSVACACTLTNTDDVTTLTARPPPPRRT